jgi:hypothetical protein
VTQRRQLTGPAWVLVWIAFTGVALTAAGPFVLLERRYLRRPEGYPRHGDWLWAVLGLPWILTAPFRPSAAAPRPAAPGGLYDVSLGITLALASIIVLAVVWNTWVLAPPRAVKSREPTPWTDRVGLVLAVAWPLQCGFGLVVLG